MGLSHCMEYVLCKEVESCTHTAFLHVKDHNFLASRVHSSHSFSLETKVKHMTRI